MEHQQCCHKAHSSMSDHGGADSMGHREHHRMMIQDFKRRFWVSLVLTFPILIFSPMIQSLFHYTLTFSGVGYVLFVFSTIIFFYGGWPFLKGSYDELLAREPGMMTLIGIAITVAYVYSSAIVFGLTGKLFFWELVSLIDIMLLGHWIEMRSVLGASRSLELLVQMMPAVAHLVRQEQVVDIELKQLHANDIVLVRPGEKVPADGVVIEGSSYLNESMLTGESKPVKREVNDKVIGGSINGSGSLQVKVRHAGADSYLAKVIHLVQEAQKTKSKTQRLADRAAQWLTFVALFAGFVTVAVWIFLGFSVSFSLERMVTVMVISCPHALGLAIPLVVSISTALSAQAGLLIRNRTAFENARKITTLLFDKTGTLTTGIFGVVRYESLSPEYSNNEMLQYAGSLEQHSEHPIAQGILQQCRAVAVGVFPASNFLALAGEGVEGVVNERSVKVVSAGYLQKHHIFADQVSESIQVETTVFVLIRDQLVGVIALADQIRPESAEAIKMFHKNGIRTVMITGDNDAVAKQVSDQLGLDGYYANTLPHQKLEIVKTLQAKGEFVAMTGDGVNDAPALAQADVGIAVGSGTDVAAETADIILVESNPKDILSLILFGKATYTKMIQNLIWAAGYNVLAIPLAGGVLYHYGVLLSPAVGAVLMSMSTVIVAFNAQLLKKHRIS